MNPKSPLPVFRGEAPKKPLTVDDARAGLGGRARTSDRAGAAVRLDHGTIGVVVFAADDSCDVCTMDGRFHRVDPSTLTEHTENLPTALAEIAMDARIFAALEEQQRVRFQGPRSEMREGLLVEKCRYGALVLNEEKKVIAISFRRLWPLP